jgi:hypothetical protein
MRGTEILFGAANHLRLPDGKSVGDVDGTALCRWLEKLRIPGASHNLGKEAAARIYADHIGRIERAGAEKALADYFAANR